METTADLLREAMARNGLDQQALAAALGADPSAVSRWLRGGRVGAGVAERLARLAGVESTYALHVMGYLPAPVDTPPGPRPLPETLLATLRELSPGAHGPDIRQASVIIVIWSSGRRRSVSCCYSVSFWFSIYFSLYVYLCHTYRTRFRLCSDRVP